jgi:hypothetical protein
LGTTLQRDFAPVVNPNILSGLTHPQNQMIPPKILPWRVVKIHATQTGVGIVEMKKIHAFFLTKRDNQLAQLSNAAVAIKPLRFEQQFELAVGDFIIERNYRVHEVTFFKKMAALRL